MWRVIVAWLSTRLYAYTRGRKTIIEKYGVLDTRLRVVSVASWARVSSAVGYKKTDNLGRRKTKTRRTKKRTGYRPDRGVVWPTRRVFLRGSVENK